MIKNLKVNLEKIKKLGKTRIIAGALAFSYVVSMATGCGTKPKTAGENEEQEQIEITMEDYEKFESPKEEKAIKEIINLLAEENKIITEDEIRKLLKDDQNDKYSLEKPEELVDAINNNYSATIKTITADNLDEIVGDIVKQNEKNGFIFDENITSDAVVAANIDDISETELAKIKEEKQNKDALVLVQNLYNYMDAIAMHNCGRYSDKQFKDAEVKFMSANSIFFNKLDREIINGIETKAAKIITEDSKKQFNKLFKDYENFLANNKSVNGYTRKQATSMGELGTNLLFKSIYPYIINNKNLDQEQALIVNSFYENNGDVPSILNDASSVGLFMNTWDNANCIENEENQKTK